MKKFQLITLLLSVFLTSQSQDFSLYERQLFIQGTDTLPCRILTPVNYNPAKKYPVVIFLHGSGERGSDNELQLKWGGSLFLDSANRARFPAIVIFPQLGANSYWARMKNFRNPNDTSGQAELITKPPTVFMGLLLNFIDTLVKNGTIDKERIYLGGLSLGGFGTFDALQLRPDLFAAAFPICGGGEPIFAKSYNKKLSSWVFHGDADQSVNVGYSRNMVEAMKNAKLDVKYTEYPGVGHDSWNNAFAEPELLPWLFSKDMKNGKHGKNSKNGKSKKHKS